MRPDRCPMVLMLAILLASCGSTDKSTTVAPPKESVPDPQPPGAGMLSVEETIRIAQIGPIDSCTEQQLVALTDERLRGNPAARPALHKILADRSVDLWKYKLVVRYFAYIGAADDIKPLTSAYEGELKDQYDRALVSGSFYALAGMAAREVPGAKEKLDQMSHWSFWDERKIRFGPDSPLGLTSVNFVLRWVLADRSQAFEANYPQIVESAIAEIPDEAQRQRMRAELRPPLSTQDSRMGNPVRDLFLKHRAIPSPSGGPEQTAVTSGGKEPPAQSPKDGQFDMSKIAVGPRNTVSWEDAQNIIRYGDVRTVAQSHACDVEVCMGNGTAYRTKEPKIDAVVDCLKECGKWGKVPLVTE